MDFSAVPWSRSEKADWEVEMYKHIIITTDGSELAMRGVSHGLSLAKHLNSKVTIITVAEAYPVQTAATPASWNEAQEKHTAAALQAAKNAADQIGVEVELVREVWTSPAPAIVETAKKLGCDLIVMASHGRRGVQRLLLGSQAAEVVHNSNVPVLIVR
ncbi:MAG TPA: universal stress protein [Paracoccaceae bacterium]|nr:universal stress protein [Paracoccaceae bacterium]